MLRSDLKALPLEIRKIGQVFPISEFRKLSSTETRIKTSVVMESVFSKFQLISQ